MSRAVNEASAAFVLPLVALTMGHVLSNAVRTLPAIAADVLTRDLDVTAEGLAALTGAFHFAFAAGQIPVGIALDRFGVRAVSFALIGLVTIGTVLAALAGGPLGYLLAQAVLGAGCSGMMLCPITLAAKILTPARFGLWGGLIQALGNCGMLLSASPLAFVVEGLGWRAGYGACAVFGVLVLALVAVVVPRTPPGPAPTRSMLADARDVVRLSVSPQLRNVVVLAFASFAVIIGARGLWGGPWLMEVKGFSRIEAGNILLIATLSLVIGPALSGVLDRRIGHRRLLLVAGHGLAAVFLGLMLLGAHWPGAWDVATLFCFGLAISTQPLIFALTREATNAAGVGRAMAAVNLSFFLGAAVLQAASGPVGAWGGPGAALGFLAACVAASTLLFMWLPGPR